MFFKDRTDAGKKLAQALTQYKGKDVVVYGLPRGGVITAVEIARYLKAPLDLIIARKIGHPFQPEYAIAAIAEDGHVVGNNREIQSVDKEWFQQEVERQKIEAKRRREKYLAGRKRVSAEGKIAILVDDGIATGLTMRASILELKHQKPQRIIIAVPVAVKSTADSIGQEADEFVSLNIPGDYEFLGAVGAYYENFYNIEDEEVITILRDYDQEYSRFKNP